MLASVPTFVAAPSPTSASDDFESRVLALVTAKGSIARKEVCKLLGVDGPQVTAMLARMVEAGKLMPEGERKDRIYRSAVMP